VLAASASLISCAPEAPQAPAEPVNLAGEGAQLRMPDEVHLKNVRQLTVGGENAEAYWAFDGSMLIYQAKKPGAGCDQIYMLDPATAVSKRISSGEGRTTCSYFYPSGREILYSSTHLHGSECPPEPDQSMGYVWGVYDSYDIFRADLDGSNLRQLTNTPGYDAEATISPVGDRIIFTSDRSGDLELYSMALDGSDVKRLTNRPGYDGGAYYSPDGSKIVWRAHYPKPGPELDDYQKLLKQGWVRPGVLEIMVANADGSNPHQITNLGGASFAPSWFASGDKIIFSSNYENPQGGDFDLYMINADGTGLEKVVDSDGFDGFPMFSPDGRYLAWESNRNNGGGTDMNVFVAEWVE
jgi:Tol biopolymer transport system component